LLAEWSKLLAEIIVFGKKCRNAAGSGMVNVATPGILKGRYDRTRLNVPAACHDHQAGTNHKSAKHLHRILLE
jgi:hypothetical protein